MNQPPLFLAVRAVSAEFAQRIYLPVVLIASGVLVVLIILLAWLVTISGWWWLLLAPVLFVSLVATILAAITGFLINLLRPAQNKAQKIEVRGFVDALQKTSEAVQTPKFIVLFRLIKDMLIPSKEGFIKELSSSASSLTSRFKTIVTSFSK